VPWILLSLIWLGRDNSRELALPILFSNSLQFQKESLQLSQLCPPLSFSRNCTVDLVVVDLASTRENMSGSFVDSPQWQNLFSFKKRRKKQDEHAYKRCNTAKFPTSAGIVPLIWLLPIWLAERKESKIGWIDQALTTTSSFTTLANESNFQFEWESNHWFGCRWFDFSITRVAERRSPIANVPTRLPAEQCCHPSHLTRNCAADLVVVYLTKRGGWVSEKTLNEEEFSLTSFGATSSFPPLLVWSKSIR
jgi:hypothetical protein